MKIYTGLVELTVRFWIDGICINEDAVFVESYNGPLFDDSDYNLWRQEVVAAIKKRYQNQCTNIQILWTHEFTLGRHEKVVVDFETDKILERQLLSTFND